MLHMSHQLRTPNMNDSELNATANTIYDRWIDGLKDMRDLSDPKAKRDQVLYLSDLQHQARELLSLDPSHPMVKQKLQIILSRRIRDAVISVTNAPLVK